MTKTQIDSVATEKFLAVLNALGTPFVSRREINDAAADAALPFPRWLSKCRALMGPRGRWENPTPAKVASMGLGYRVGGRGRKQNIAVHSGAKSRPAPVRHVSVPSNFIPAPAPAMAMAVPPTPVPVVDSSLTAAASAAVGADLVLAPTEYSPYVPAKAAGYVPFGHFETVSKVIASKHFLPVMITGPSGNGKTEMVEQAAAALGRIFIRVSITNQTDEDDLIGGFRLINGDMKFALGPIPMGMISGATTLLDEVDLGTAPLMCLQPVLEGKPLFIKKIGKYIYPAPGFNIIATSNTKGRGDDGRYAHTNVMNDAMLERFAVLFEQSWPDAAVERKILNHVLKAEGQADPTLARHLVEFANVTRKNFDNQVCADQIATRRLLHIVRTYCTLGNIDQVMSLTLARFDKDTAEAFTNLWKAIHETAVPSPSGAAIPTPTTENAPF